MMEKQVTEEKEGARTKVHLKIEQNHREMNGEKRKNILSCLGKYRYIIFSKFSYTNQGDLHLST